MGLPVIVKARARPTRRGQMVSYLSWAFILVWLLGIDAFLRGIGLPNDQRSFPFRLTLVSLAFVPVALDVYIDRRPRLSRRLGLIDALPANATMDLRGLHLTLDGIERPWIPWDAVASLERSGRDWRLVGVDGSTLAQIPEPLMWPPPTWTDAPSLAELIVQLRPDRFALHGERYEPGMTEFAIREPGDIVGRPRLGVQKRVVVIGVVLFGIAFGLLVATMPAR